MRRLVSVICGGAIVALGAALYLNLLGVPKPILRRIVERINASGIPVDIEEIHLSLHGWKATNVRYYSRHPDDLKPVLYSGEVFVRSSKLKDGHTSGINGYRLVANGIEFSPSVEWCIGLPEDSALRTIDQVQLSLARTTGRVLVEDGLIEWNNVAIHFSGSLLERKKAGLESKMAVPMKAWHPLVLDEQAYHEIENAFQALELSEGAEMRIDFSVDAGNPLASQLALSARTGTFEYRDVSFSGAELALSYEQSRFRLNHAVLYKDNEQFSLKGEYDMDTKMLTASASNGIESKRLFLLLPQAVLNVLSQNEVRLEAFPRFDIEAGPIQPRQLLQKLAGSFDLNSVVLQGLQLEALHGSIERKGSRLDISGLKGDLVGQQYRSNETGSSMIGGTASGAVFLDTAKHEFGVTGDCNFDPNLLIKPLSGVRIATNVISRFKFDGPAPDIHLELGADYENWRSFYINLRGTATDLRLSSVPLSSLSATSQYREGVLSLNRVVAKQEITYLKGSAAIDFRHGQADFDVSGNLNPNALEDVIYPRYGVFSRHVKMFGDIKVGGRGTVDWRYMRDTAFSVELEAERMDLPVASIDRFSATVSGEGPNVSIHDATFGIYDGAGRGTFSLVLDPATSGVPYQVDIVLENANFNKFLKYIDPKKGHGAKGNLWGQMQASADLTSRFFESANGRGYVDIRSGQLADLPLFSGFSNLIRMVIPSFKVFSIERLYGDFQLKNGVVHADNACFEGDLLSAKGRGQYSVQDGFDASVQVQMFSDSNLSKVVRFFTDPFLKLFEMKLSGTLRDPEWKLKTFSAEGGNG